MSMGSDEVRAILTGDDIPPPFTVHTKGGRSYHVRDSLYLWSPPGYPDVVAIAGTNALAIVRLESIDSITCEERTETVVVSR